MALSGWNDIAEQAKALLGTLSRQSYQANESEQRGRGCVTHPALTQWEPLQPPHVDGTDLLKKLQAMKCSEVVQQWLVSAYLANGKTLASTCSRAFDTTMRNIASASNPNEMNEFRSAEGATRTRFNFELDQQLAVLGDMLLEQVRCASKQSAAMHDSCNSMSRPAEVDNPKITGTFLHPAGSFTGEVNKILLTAFHQFEHLTKGERLALAKRTGLREKQIVTWFANQRQRRTRRPTSLTNEVGPSQRTVGTLLTEHTPRAANQIPSSSANPQLDIIASLSNLPQSYRYVPTPPIPVRSSVEPLTDFGARFNRTPMASYDSDVSTFSYNLDTSDYSLNSLDSKWSHDASDSYYGLPIPPTGDVDFSFGPPSIQALEPFDYSPDKSNWNAYDSSFSSSSSSTDSYLDDYAFQLPTGVEDTNTATCGLLSADQATFAESPSSMESSPMSIPDIDIDMDINSAFGQISEFGVLPTPLDTNLALGSPV
ncbi:BQ2448_3357 [Microbotryum intermedium]|uniref:BQ2448_3357 protein n=1 Tax=Microbotryum intermedium TaxID=269621 RepID=A0A238FBL9_9BASI|nr:BQ2448_3357 [Microbotryum intermedium]